MGRKAYFLELMAGEQSCDAVGMLRNEFLFVCAKYRMGQTQKKYPASKEKRLLKPLRRRRRESSSQSSDRATDDFDPYFLSAPGLLDPVFCL
jgi:hypothetical protein